jgi:hypothetical protein
LSKYESLASTISEFLVDELDLAQKQSQLQLRNMGRNLPEPEQRKPETVRKAKKRKRDEAVLDLPDGVVADLPGASVEQSEDKVEAEARQKKKKKKKKQDRMEGLSNGHLDGAGAEGAAEGGDGKKKKKKRAGTDESAEAREASTLKEKKKKSKESTPLDPSSDKSKKKRKNDQAAENAEDSPVADQSGDPQKSDRFIVFIGTLFKSSQSAHTDTFQATSHSQPTNPQSRSTLSLSSPTRSDTSPTKTNPASPRALPFSNSAATIE